MMECMNACIKVMDKITETPDESGLLTLTSQLQRCHCLRRHIRHIMNTNSQSDSVITHCKEQVLETHYLAS